MVRKYVWVVWRVGPDSIPVEAPAVRSAFISACGGTGLLFFQAVDQLLQVEQYGAVGMLVAPTQLPVAEARLPQFIEVVGQGVGAVHFPAGPQAGIQGITVLEPGELRTGRAAEQALGQLGIVQYVGYLGPQTGAAPGQDGSQGQLEVEVVGTGPLPELLGDLFPGPQFAAVAPVAAGFQQGYGSGQGRQVRGNARAAQGNLQGMPGQGEGPAVVVQYEGAG